MSLQVVILAGGLATRLQPVTALIPKSLVDVAGQPFAVHQIELLRRHGLTDIAFLVGHLGELIRDTLGDGTRWGVRLRYIFDGARRLGTGGAVCRALSELDNPFFVLYGDSYLECDYAAIEKVFLSSGKRGLMTVYRNDDRLDRSNVLYVAGRIIRYDKQRRAPEMRAPTTKRPISLQCIRICSQATSSPDTRFRIGFTRSGRPRGSNRHGPTWLQKEYRRDELRQTASRRNCPRRGRPRRAGNREDGSAAG